MKISEILTRHPVCIGITATLVQAAQQMKILDVGTLPVCSDDGLVLGIVTDRDIVIRGVAKELDLKTTRVGNIMSEDIISCFEDQDVAEAARLMEVWQVRRLPVLDREKKLVGIISLGDFAKRTGEIALTAEVLGQVSTPAALCEPAQLVA